MNELDLIESADAIGMFCRQHMHAKKDLPIRASEMGVLIFTHKQDARVTPLSISQFFKISKPSVTTMVNALLKGGYLSKEASETDKRSYTLGVTEKGRLLLEETFSSYIKTVALLRDRMGADDFQRFIALMNQANLILEEERA